LRRAAAALLLLALPAVAQQPPWWEAHLHAFAPALRACIADRPGAMVVAAWPMDHGLAGARVLLPDGVREDCVADTGRAVVERRMPVAAGDRRPDEGLRAFMLERRCVDAWRVEDDAGREVGWLAYPACG
jgi:hypothetical protein